MQRYFIYLKYDGTNYHGWQVQPNGNSVQAEIERGLSLLMGKKTEITGAGRTDAGVHASMMVAHFDSERELDGVQLAYKLNRIVPRDISIDRIIPVDSDMHARFSPVSRTYHYYIYQGKNPFLRHYAWEVWFAPDYEAMNKAAEHLLGTKDFSAFCKSGSDVKTKICTVTEARWEECGEGRWRFVITANRFLRNMVRAVVGTLIDVGRGRISPGEFENIIKGGKRTDAGESVPGNALFLQDIRYGSL